MSQTEHDMFSARPASASCKKNHCFATTELRLVFPQPSKNVADFEGFYKIEFSSRCGKRQLFCNSQ